MPVPSTPTLAPHPSCTDCGRSAAASSSSVHPSETNLQNSWTCEEPSHPLDVQSQAQIRLHWRHRHDRRRVIDAFDSSGRPELLKRLSRMADCCRLPQICETSDGRPGLALGRCRDRMCPLCQWHRGQEASRRIVELVRTIDAPRLITLTIKSSDELLGVQLDRMFAAFAKLRRLDAWKRHVRGGVWAIEVTFNQQTGQWHPHIHIIAEGSYFPHETLKSAWLACTGDSSIVDLRKVNDRRDAARYISAYVSKPCSLDKLPDSRLIEYADALHRRRLTGTFGCLHAARVQRKEDAGDPPSIAPLISARRLNDLVDSGNEAAIFCVGVFAAYGRTWRQLFGIPEFPDKRRWKPPDPADVERALKLARSLSSSSDPPAAPPRRDSPPSIGQQRLADLYCKAGHVPVSTVLPT